MRGALKIIERDNLAAAIFEKLSEVFLLLLRKLPPYFEMD